MKGRVIPYLKEVRLASNLPASYKVRMYLAAYLHVSVLYSGRRHVSSALRLQAYLDSR